MTNKTNDNSEIEVLQIEPVVEQCNKFLNELKERACTEFIVPKEISDSGDVDCPISEYEEEVIKHVGMVKDNIYRAIRELNMRANIHDASKLREDEFSIMEESFPKLRVTTYGSEEYKQLLADIKPALDLHYARNDHHPEHFENGVNDMNLFQVMEMLCDWKAAVEKHEDGDIYKSLEINKERFGLSDQLYSILKNTIDKW